VLNHQQRVVIPFQVSIQKEATLLCFMVGLVQNLSMFGQANGPTLELSSSGAIRMQAQPGYVYQVQKTDSVHAPITWQAFDVPKQVIEAGQLEWNIAPFDQLEAYYRVQVKEVVTQQGLSLTEAETKVITELIQPENLSSLALGLRWPETLSAGAVVEPIIQPVNTSPVRWEVEEDAYFFVIDHAPSQKLGHPFTWVLVSRSSGVTRTRSSFYPPQNGDMSPFDTLSDRWNALHRFYPVDFDGSQPALAHFWQVDIPPIEDGFDFGLQSLRHTDRTPLQPRGFTVRNEAIAVSTIDCTQVTPRKVAVVVASGADYEIQNDAREMGTLLGNLGFTVTSYNSETDSVSDVQQGIQQAAQGLGPCDKFFLYISSHTELVDENDDGRPDHTPIRLDYGLGHNTKSKWSILPRHPASVSLTAGLQTIFAGQINIMLDTCFAGAMASLIRQGNVQPPAGVEWNIFASSTESKTSAGALELDLWLDINNDDVNGAYTEIILEQVEQARTANTIDTNQDGQLSVDEIEQAFLAAQFTAEDRLAEAQMPEFDRFIGPLPCVVVDDVTLPTTVTQTVSVSENDVSVPGVRYVLVRPPAIHPSLYTWDEATGTLQIIGLSELVQLDFDYKMVIRSFETPAVTSIVRFDLFGAINLTPFPSTDDPQKEVYRVPCLVLGNGLHYPVYQFRLANNPLDECLLPHWHAHGNVFAIDVSDNTGRPDPNPPTCGFGVYGEVEEATIEVEVDVFEQFKIDHLPPL
jgi:hypothetical protein